MMGRRLNYVLVSAVLFVPTAASAHIHLLSPLSHTDDATGNPQKNRHCGETEAAPWIRADHPDRATTFLPGSTITVTWAETIQHPGHFRVSFQPDGLVFAIPPPGAGVDGFPDVDQTGITGPEGATILKDMILDGTLSTDITLPNVECANCTLQLIQVMTDKPPYTTDLASNDIYFNCADIVLSASAPDAAPAGIPDAGGGNPAGSDADVGGNGGGATGGCSTGGGSSGVLLALGLGALLVRRRRP
jgi:MYXO-CTERM domain-containing protein